MTQIIFNHPWLLLITFLPFVIIFFVPSYRQKAFAVRIPFFKLAIEASGKKAADGVLIYKKPMRDRIIGTLVWCCLVIALADPILLGASKEEAIISRDIMLAVDLSGSMEESDFPNPNGQPTQRLQAVKDVLSTFIQDRKQDRIGLIVFGTKAYLQVPFTQDLDSTVAILNDSSVNMAGPHTAIGDAIGLALKTFSDSKIEKKVLILLTDGADTGSRMSPINAAHIAQQEQLTIFTIGIGDEHSQSEYRVDFNTLQQIATITEGAFFAASDATTLAKIYSHIDEIAQPQTAIKVTQEKTSLMAMPIMIAALLLVLAFILNALNTHREAADG